MNENEESSIALHFYAHHFLIFLTRYSTAIAIVRSIVSTVRRLLECGYGVVCLTTNNSFSYLFSFLSSFLSFIMTTSDSTQIVS